MARRRRSSSPPETAPAGLSPAEAIHFDLLARWRDAMDLVGPGPMVPHFIDAAAAGEALGPIEGRWADLGSGAGFPGIALAGRNPEATMVLVESRRKRATFLDTVTSEARAADAGLANVRVECGRTEDLSGPFDGLISRAYKAPEGVLDDAARLLAPSGRVVLMLGDSVLEDSDWEAPAGWVVLARHRYAVPDGFRRLVVLQRSP